MRRIVAVATAVALSGCGAPRDPEGTLERVRGGRMRVGVTEEAPWTVVDGPSGVEVELVEAYAEGLGAQITWHRGSEHELLSALEARELDLVIGGLTEENLWAGRVALTRPYHEVEVLVGAPPGQQPPDDVDDLRVTVEAGTEVGRLVEDAGGTAIRVEELAAQAGPVAAEDWRLAALGLQPTDIVLAETKHVMAAPPGENAWLVRLERFLTLRAGGVDDLLQAHAE